MYMITLYLSIKHIHGVLGLWDALLLNYQNTSTSIPFNYNNFEKKKNKRKILTF